MAYYNNNHPNNNANANHNNAWAGPPSGNQVPWEPSRPASHANATGAKPSPALGYDGQPQAHSRSSATGPNDHGEPFYYQFKSIDRALETWRKSTKAGNEARGAMGPRFPPPVEFTPIQPPFNGPPPPNFFPPIPPPPPGPSPRFSGARSNDLDQSFQAKRRMAAQRERDLRNYHQDQQFNKHLSGAKSDRSMSPNAAMSETDRRELIARQHRALYGEDSSLYNGDSPRAGHRPQDQHGNAGTDNSASLSTNEGQRQPRSRAASNTSPTATANNSNNISSGQQQDDSQHSPPREHDSSVVPIGTRQQQHPSASANGGAGPKRSSPPVTSPSYGQSQGDGPASGNSTNNQASSSSNTATISSSSNQEEKPGNTRGAWGNSGAWGQPKVWG